MRVTAKNILKDKVKGIVEAHSTVDHVYFAKSYFGVNLCMDLLARRFATVS